MALYYTCSFATMLLTFVIFEEKIAGHICCNDNGRSSISELSRNGNAFYKPRNSAEAQKPETAFSVEPNTYRMKEPYNNNENIKPYTFYKELYDSDGERHIIFPITILYGIKPDPLECSSANSRRNNDNVPKSRDMKHYAKLTHDTKGKDEKFANRIIGGEDVHIATVPYQVSIQRHSLHHCGGTIITNLHVVTAAHCTSTSQVKDLRIRAGSSYSDHGGVLIDVAEKFEHPWFNQETLDWDVSVIKLASHLNFDDRIQPIRLPKESVTWKPGTRGLVSGWGLTEEGSPETAPSQLMATLLYLEDKNECRRRLNIDITDRTLCASGGPESKDTCQGDSGGALVVERVLAGIVSWGIGCGRPGMPGILTNVPKVVGFIKYVVML